MEGAVEPTSERLWDDASRRLRDTLNETTYATWFASTEPGPLSDDVARARRSQRVHAELDREPLPRAPPCGGARCARPRDPCGARRLRHGGHRGGAAASRCPAALPGRAAAREPEVHVRQLRDRVLEPVRARCRARGRRGAGAGVQPPLHLRQHRSRQDAPHAGRERLCQRSLEAAHDALRDERDVHERLHQLAPRQAHRGVQAPLPRVRRPPRRRHPVPRGQGADPGGVLPYLQLALRGRPADRDLVRPAAEGDRNPRGAASLAVRVGAHDRHPASRPRDAHRDPPQEGHAPTRSRSPTRRC